MGVIGGRRSRVFAGLLALCVAALVAGLSPLGAQVATPFWGQVGADLEGEAGGDSFGGAVAISDDGNTIIIGATGPFGGTGYVRIYRLAGNTWTQLGSDIEGIDDGDDFGGAVVISADGHTVIIGASGPFGAAGYSGVYRFTNGAWAQLGSDIDGEAAGDRSGGSVAMSDDGNTVIVGAERNDGANGSSSGHARIFNYDVTTDSWDQVGGDIDGEAANDRSGGAVAMSADGNTVIIGAYSNDGANGSSSGHARIFNYDVTTDTWDQVGGDIDGEAVGDFSGGAVAMSADGNTVIIGAEENVGVNGDFSGHARIFNYDGTAWNQVGGDIDGEGEFDAFGFAVAMSADGSRVTISAPFGFANGDFPGNARVFDYDGASWNQVGENLDGEFDDGVFGYAVAMSADGNRMIIGGPGGGGVANLAGHARVFDAAPDGLVLLDAPCVVGSGPVSPGTPFTVQVTGATCDVPASASSAIVSLQSVTPSGSGNLRVSEAGVAPAGGVVNYAANSLSNSNTVTVPLSAGGAIDVAANASASSVAVVVIGYYDATGSLAYTPLTPCAVADSRSSQGPTGNFVGPFTEGGAPYPDIDVVGTFPAGQGSNGTTNCGVPASADAVMVNVVAVGGSGFPGGIAVGTGGTEPALTTTNFAPIGLNNAAATIVPLNGGETIAVNLLGQVGASTHVRLVVLGFYENNNGLDYVPVNPCAAFDSRVLNSDPDNAPTGAFAGKRLAGSAAANNFTGTTTYNVTGSIPAAQGGASDCGVPDGVSAVLVNLVGIQPDALGNFRAFATGSTPTGGVLNFANLTPAMNNSNAVVVPVNASGDMDVFINAPSNVGNPTVHARGVILGYYTN